MAADTNLDTRHMTTGSMSGATQAQKDLMARETFKAMCAVMNKGVTKGEAKRRLANALNCSVELVEANLDRAQVCMTAEERVRLSLTA